MSEAVSWGLVYHSDRDPNGQSIAALRPPISYAWDGTAVTDVFEKNRLE